MPDIYAGLAEERATDITIEIFNHCDGSCTGCVLSIAERRASSPVMTPEQFAKALDRLTEWGDAEERLYRPVLVFGDFPWLPLETQQHFYQALKERNLPFGVTMTLVDTARSDHYHRALEHICAADPGAVFDITVDPVRLERQDDYAALIRSAAQTAPHLHLQILLSEAVLEGYSPESLSDLCRDRIGDFPLSLGFTPTLQNLSRRNYRYAITSASDYATRFYQTTAALRAHFEAEINRFDGIGSYSDFVRQTFHIGPGLDIFAVAYTIWGDVIMDARNGGQPLGNIANQPLAQILAAPALQRQTIHNNIWMEKGDFGCATCDFMPHCQFHGIGAVRKLYRDYEQRTGSCYGPRQGQI